MGCPCIVVAAYNGLLRALDDIHGKSEIGMGCDGDFPCRDRDGGPGEADVDTGMTEGGMEVGPVDRVVALPVAVKDNCLGL